VGVGGIGGWGRVRHWVGLVLPSIGGESVGEVVGYPSRRVASGVDKFSGCWLDARWVSSTRFRPQWGVKVRAKRLGQSSGR
jgi:hypothetical protein